MAEPITLTVARRLSVAPMMACTDRHARYLMRLISRRTLLYTEMVSTGALLHGDAARHLARAPQEQPVALQLGGNEPGAMAQSAALGNRAGYDEINMNVGCPSPRVKAGCFGAALMAEPDLVARCVAAMRTDSDVPVTVKTRIGIDDLDSYSRLRHFIETVAAAGCQTFIIHARKAWLNGLSPRENREIPPLRYDVVDRLCEDYPELGFVLNGGIASLAEAAAHIDRVGAAMIGRAAYASPYLLAEADGRVHGAPGAPPDRAEVVRAYHAYARDAFAKGVPLPPLMKPLLGLFHGVDGARHWRRELSQGTYTAKATPDLFIRALERVECVQSNVRDWRDERVSGKSQRGA
ncbi:MAG: tRNA dihydrouridine(20/20a) synthase DusA [Pseudomonadota bacterium]